jgi:hypothetical protein
MVFFTGKKPLGNHVFFCLDVFSRLMAGGFKYRFHAMVLQLGMIGWYNKHFFTSNKMLGIGEMMAKQLNCFRFGN